MPDAQHAVVFAFTLGIMVGLGAAHLINVYVVDAFSPHPQNNKQYTPPLNDEAPVVAHPPLNLLEGPSNDD